MIMEIGGGGGSAPTTPKAAQAHCNGSDCSIKCPKGEDSWVAGIRALTMQRFAAAAVAVEADVEGLQLGLWPELSGKDLLP